MVSDDAIAAWEEWITIHTIENRTPQEMFLAGYITARTGAENAG